MSVSLLLIVAGIVVAVLVNHVLGALMVLVGLALVVVPQLR